MSLPDNAGKLTRPVKSQRSLLESLSFGLLSGFFVLCFFFFFFLLTLWIFSTRLFRGFLVPSPAELVEHQVSGRKDMVTGSRPRTSVCQLCICLHLTPAKSLTRSHSRSTFTLHPPAPQHTHTIPKRFSFLLSRKGTSPGSHTLLQHCSITLTPPSRRKPSYHKLWKLVTLKGD